MTNYEAIRHMLTTGEVARLFGVQAVTVRRWNARGTIRAYRIGPRGERRFRREDVGALLLEKAARRYLADRRLH